VPFRNTIDLPEINNIDELTKELLKKENTDLKSFGKELKYLFKKGYTYDLTNNIFIK
jgi:hypothetical protein